MTSHSSVPRKRAILRRKPILRNTRHFFAYRSAPAGGKELDCESVSLARIVGAQALRPTSTAAPASNKPIASSIVPSENSRTRSVTRSKRIPISPSCAFWPGSAADSTLSPVENSTACAAWALRAIESYFPASARRATKFAKRSAIPERARADGILLFNVESEAELEVLLDEASRHVNAGGETISAAIRVNPDVLAGGHPHISTGHHRHKFGMSWQEARRLYLAHKDSRAISWRGISAHIGSQILAAAPYRQALQRLASYVRDLRKNGIPLDFIDIGGGLGIRYTNEKVLDPAVYARTLLSVVKPLGCHLLLEPGRTLVGPAGVLLTRVLYVKKNGGKTFVVVDAAMNDLIRPVLYGAAHPITIAKRPAAGATSKKVTVDVVGPVCESGDFLAHDWPLEPVKQGDLLVVWAAGAYASVQSSNYNARPRPAEILVEGKKFRVVRRRQTRADLVRGELARA